MSFLIVIDQTLVFDTSKKSLSSPILINDFRAIRTCDGDLCVVDQELFVLLRFGGTAIQEGAGIIIAASIRTSGSSRYFDGIIQWRACTLTSDGHNAVVELHYSNLRECASPDLCDGGGEGDL